MNIREHIEAGHYPVDDKGRALVPMRDGSVATIYGTDFGNRTFPVIGWDVRGVMRQWQSGGHDSLCGESPRDLLPPPPRKGTARAWVVYPVASDGLPCWGQPAHVYDNPHDPAQTWPGPTWVTVEMTHEYEVSW